MLNTLRRIGINGLLVLISLGVAYLAAEWLFVRWGAPLLSLSRHSLLPEAARTLAQSSKAAGVPRDYLVLVGDSYAQGSGEWFWEVDHGANPPFHTAHVIHQRTGRDVITHGASGAGSVDGLLVEPVARQDWLANLWSARLPLPERVVALFYEGNDLDNNLSFIQRHLPDRALPEDLPALRRHLVERVLPESHAYRLVHTTWRRQRLLNQLPLAQYLLNAFAARRVAAGEGGGLEAAVPGTVNRAVVGGAEVALPDRLQSPSLELTGEEMGWGVAVFQAALAEMAAHFRGAVVDVVYLPSPLASYRLVGPEVSIQEYWGRGERHPAARVGERSDALCRAIARASEAVGAGFADARPALRGVAEGTPVHGPREWKHFNRLGYETLADVIITLDRTPGRRIPCR